MSENSEPVYERCLDDITKKELSLLLYKDVENVEEVYNKVISKELPCCILKANLIIDPFQVVIAANKAALNEKYEQMVTRTLYTELIYCLSTSKNISQSLNTFGVTKDTKNILVALIYESQDKSSQQNLVSQSIKGQRLCLSKLAEISDVELIKKTYKISNDELTVSSLLNSIVSRISDKIIK